MDEIVSVGELCDREPTVRLLLALFFSRSVECFVFALAVVACYELSGRKFLFFLVMLANIGLSTVLKSIVRQPRPPSSCLDSYGMPSGHAQTIFFAATILIFLTARKFFTKHHPLHEWGVFAYRSALTLLFAFFAAQSRVVLGHHTVPQVIVGAVLGVVFALLLLSPYIVQARRRCARTTRR